MISRTQGAEEEPQEHEGEEDDMENINGLLSEAQELQFQKIQLENEITAVCQAAEEENFDELIETIERIANINSEKYQQLTQINQEILLIEDQKASCENSIQIMKQQFQFNSQIQVTSLSHNDRDNLLQDLVITSQQENLLLEENQKLQENITFLSDHMIQILLEINQKSLADEIQASKTSFNHRLISEFITQFDHAIIQVQNNYSDLGEKIVPLPKDTGKIPFNYERYQLKHQHLMKVNQIIAGVDHTKEGQKLLSQDQLNEFGLNRVKEAMSGTRRSKQQPQGYSKLRQSQLEAD